ncbi:MAG: anaerobic ribonucleoside-triphosphate reductase activating protein [Muribaculaceae bacterium]|nr:anaerobic ribonucleoside-triphosphate reductase activating protein [Muribaculaceae bacterium]
MFTYKVLDIRRGTTVDGPGFRTSIYFAGCNHACPGCHNPESWNFNGGVEMSADEILKVIEEEDFDVTLSGGDPLMHPEKINYLCREIKSRLNKNIWLFTGYTISEIRLSPSLRKGVEFVDTLVEGRFVQSLRDPDLSFRGSSNQRIIPLFAKSE